MAPLSRQIAMTLVVCSIAVTALPSVAFSQTILTGVIKLTALPKYEGVNCPEGLFYFEVTKDMTLIIKNNIAEVVRTKIAQDGSFAFTAHSWQAKGNANNPTFEMWTLRRPYDCRYMAGFYQHAQPK